MVSKTGNKKAGCIGAALFAAWSASCMALALAVVFTASARAADAKKPGTGAHASGKAVAGKADPNKGYRKKELNFEERVIEGLSNRGYESLSQTGTADALKGEKLYRKRAEFDEDSKSLLREMEYLK